MKSFVRFIFIVLIAGIAVNLCIVLLANNRSQRQQTQDQRRAKEQFQTLVQQTAGARRRLDIVVESQRYDATGAAVESTLLVRQYGVESQGKDEAGTESNLRYGFTGGQKNVPLRLSRVVIPGNRVSVEGMILELASSFADDAEDFQIAPHGNLRDAQLAYFSVIAGEGQTAPANGTDDRFTLAPAGFVPELTRLQPFDDQPTFYELRLWQYIWGLIGELPRGTADRALPFTRHGLTVSWARAETHEVRLKQVYTAKFYTDLDGSINIEEGTAEPGVWDEMISEGKRIGEDGEVIGKTPR